MLRTILLIPFQFYPVSNFLPVIFSVFSYSAYWSVKTYMSKQHFKPYSSMYQGNCISDTPHFEGLSQGQSARSACKCDEQVSIPQECDSSKYFMDTQDREPAEIPYNNSAENLDQSKHDTSYSYLFSSNSSPTPADPLQHTPEMSLLGPPVRNNSIDGSWSRLFTKVFASFFSNNQLYSLSCDFEYRYLGSTLSQSYGVQLLMEGCCVCCNTYYVPLVQTKYFI